MKKILILADFSWMLHRYLHVFKDLSVTINGQEHKTGTIFGFCYFLESIYKRFLRDDLKIIFCKDDKSKERLEELESYKGQRENKADLNIYDDIIGSIICSIPFVHFCEAPDKEADDVMALLALSNKEKYDDIIIYSGDNDMLQLISEGIHITKTFDKNGFIYVTEEYLDKKFGITDFKYLLYLRALLGDVSDNIPIACSGLRKLFLNEFVKHWEATDLESALNPELYKNLKIPRVNISEQLKLLTNAQDNIIRNFKLMSLLKYKNATNQFLLNQYKMIPNESLISLYQLEKFKQLLEYVTIMKTQRIALKNNDNVINNSCIENISLFS